MASWKDLEAQGVKNCCAMFKSGKQCRRRAANQQTGGFCAKHGPMIAQAIEDLTKGCEEEMGIPSQPNSPDHP